MRLILGFFITYLFCFTTFGATLSASQPIKLYRAPDNTSQMIQTLPNDTTVTVIASNQHKGYILVQTDAGVQGWVIAEQVKQAPTANNTNSSMEQLKQHSQKTFSYLASKSPEIAKQTKTYANTLTDHYHRYFSNAKEDRRWFIAGAFVLMIGILIGLLIGRLMWRRNKSYIR